MGGLVSLDVVYVALLFLVPGYVFLAFRGHFAQPRRVEGAEFYVRLLALSAVNFALWGWLIYVAIAEGVDPILRAVLWAAVLVLLPAATGLLSGIWTKAEWLRRLYSVLGMTPIHYIPTAWDYKFGNGGPRWIFITLKDGTEYGGWWSGSSFASSQPAERDLLVERVYRVPIDGSAWQPTGRSLLVSAGEIRTIEFVEEQIDGDQG